MCCFIEKKKYEKFELWTRCVHDSFIKFRFFFLLAFFPHSQWLILYFKLDDSVSCQYTHEASKEAIKKRYRSQNVC